MRSLLPIIASLPTLAGCAADYDKSAYAGCNHQTPPDRHAQWEIVAPNIMSLGMDMQTKKRLGIANSNQVAPDAAACLRDEDNRTHRPQIQDLQKIGRLPGPGSHLA